MKQLTLTNDLYKIVDAEGTVLLEAPISDLYYTIALASENEHLSARQKAEIAAQQINEEYKTSLTWGQIIVLFNELTDEMEKLKKNTIVTQE